MNRKLAYAAPLPSTPGVKVRLPSSAAGITWSAFTVAPASASAPRPGSVTTLTLASASPGSGSVKPKSAAPNRYAVSSAIVTVRFEALGAVLSSMIVPVAVSVVAPPANVALVASDRVSVKVSACSWMVSSTVATGTAWLVCPGAKVRVPAAAVKSAAAAVSPGPAAAA